MPPSRIEILRAFFKEDTDNPGSFWLRKTGMSIGPGVWDEIFEFIDYYEAAKQLP